MEADAGAVTAHVAYEMRETGTTDIWEALVGFERYRDIAVAYDEARATTGSVARAMGAAFEQWYASDWRRERYYVATCSAYLDRIDETHLVPSYGLLDEAYFDCSSAVSLYCGTGGCAIDFAVGETTTQAFGKGWAAADDGGRRVIYLNIHGSGCGGTNLDPCFQKMMWTGAGFTLFPPQGG